MELISYIENKFSIEGIPLHEWNMMLTDILIHKKGMTYELTGDSAAQICIENLETKEYKFVNCIKEYYDLPLQSVGKLGNPAKSVNCIKVRSAFGLSVQHAHRCIECHKECLNKLNHGMLIKK